MITAAKCNCFTTTQVQKSVGPLNSMKDAAILTDLQEQSAQLVLIELSLLNMKMLKKTHHYTQEQTDIINTPTCFPTTLQAYEEDLIQSLNFIHTV